MRRKRRKHKRREQSDGPYSMAEFEERVTVCRIVELFREHGKEKTPTQVRGAAEQVRDTLNLESIACAYQELEQALLKQRPKELPPWPDCDE